MTVQNLAQILRVRWKLICGAMVVAVLGALAYTLLATPQYQASTRLFVATTSDGTNSQTYDGGLFAERRVLSYTELLTGEVLAQRTIDRLGLDMSAGELQAEIEASVPINTVLIDVTVSDRNPARARDIVNALADEFVVMAAGLETPQLGAEPNARVIILQRAAISDDPVNSKLVRTLGIAAALGAFIGVFLALVRDRTDDKVRSSADIERATGVGLLAEIPFEAGRRNETLASFENDHSATAEVFRELRVNLRFLEVAEGPRVIVVASALPDEGRTTTAINLALALAEANNNVVVVDGDMRRPQVATLLGLGGSAGLSTVLTGEVSLADALQQTRFPRVTALASGAVPPNPTTLLESQAAKDVLDELGRNFDHVIVDSPSLLVTDAALLAATSQGVLMVARFGRTKRSRLEAAISTLRRAGAPLLGAVLTMTPAKKRSRDSVYYVGANNTKVRGGRWRRGSHEK